MYKSLYWHVQNLNNNKISLKRNQVKVILENLRDIKFLKDDIYLNDVSNILIDFFPSNIKLKNLNLFLWKSKNSKY